MENKRNEILNLVKKGLSLSLATLLVTANLTACETVPTDTTASTTAGIHDTTTLPNDDTTTLPNDDTTTTKPADQLSKEDQEFLNNFYASLASYDSRYANGIGKISIEVTKSTSDTTNYYI